MAESKNQDLSEERKSTPRRALYWQRQIGRARKREQSWRDAARDVLKRYRAERDDLDSRQRFNVLYANTETIRPAIYAQPPKPDVRRRFLDKDPVARAAAEVLQRALSACIDIYDLDGLTRRAIQDYLLPGRGVLRVKYRPVTGGAGDGEKLLYQEALSEYVPWSRFVMLPASARNWSEVRAVAYGVDVTRADAERQFGKVADELTYGNSNENREDEPAAERTDTALVWEVWSKDDRRVYVVADQGYDKHLTKPVDDPLKLEGFFPQPEPLYSLASNDTLIPRPEYAQYQDQAEELDDVTNRITKITDQLRVRGIRDASKPILQELAGAVDGDLLGVEDWLAISSQGGLDKLIAYLPIDHLAKVLLQLYNNRDRVKQTIYEITGVADIVRGASNAQETATAQNIKSKWAGIRVSERQQAVQKFLRNLLRIKAEVIAEHFTPETLAMMTGIQLPTGQQKQLAMQAMAAAQQQQAPPDPRMKAMLEAPSWDEVLSLLRQDKLRSFRIDIETDSTIRGDADEEQRNRTEMLTSITGYLGAVSPLVQQGAMPLDLAREMLVWAVRSFRVGPQLEQALEQLGAEQAGPSPQVQQAQAQLQQQQQQMAQQAAEIAKREKAATDREHQAELAAKDAQRAIDKANYEAKANEIKQNYYEQAQKMQEQLEQRLEALAKVAESAVEEAQQEAARNKEVIAEKDDEIELEIAPAMQQLREAIAQQLAELKASLDQPKIIEYGPDGEPVTVGGRPVIYGPDGELRGIQ